MNPRASFLLVFLGVFGVTATLAAQPDTLRTLPVDSAAMPEGIHDGRRQIFPTEEEDTEDALLIVRAEIARYVKHRDALPDSLRQLFSLPAVDPVLAFREEWLLDGWGQPLVYRRVGDRAEIRSVGRDARRGTSDDMVDWERLADLRLPPAQALLMRELRAQRRRQGSTVDGTPRFTQSTSMFPGVVYHWAVYVPPRSAHVVFTVLAVDDGGRLAVVRSPETWWAAVGRRLPSTPAMVEGACAEAIHATFERGFPGAPPRVYRDARWLEGERLAGRPIPDTLRARLVQRLEPPVVERLGETGWNVRLWALGFWSVRRYDCRFTPGGFTLTASESVTEPSPFL